MSESDDVQQSPYQALVDIAWGAMADLAPRDWRVLELRHGLSDGKSRTLEIVGDELGVTRERIRQLQVKATGQFLAGGTRRRLLAVASRIRDLDDHTVPPADSHAETIAAFVDSGATTAGAKMWIDFLIRELRDEFVVSPERRAGIVASITKNCPRVCESLEIVNFEDFVEACEEFGVTQPVAVSYFEELKSGSGWVGYRSLALRNRHKELAYAILRFDPEPMHWRELLDRVNEITVRDLSPTAFYNAVSDDPKVFAYQSAGTYGLVDGGYTRVPFLKDVMVECLKENGAPMSISELEAVVRQRRTRFKSASLMMLLTAHQNAGVVELFYESLEDTYGLREWLPEAVTLRTPLALRESKKSRERYKFTVR